VRVESDCPNRKRGSEALVETCKLSAIDPQRYLADLLHRLVNGWPQSRIDELMPRCWAKAQSA
jgi:transposase